MKLQTIAYAISFLLVFNFTKGHSQDQYWSVEETSDGSSPSGLDETSYVKCGGKMYLVGGRGNLPIEEYDPASSSWTQKVKTPNLNHFQAVSLNDKVYIVCAFSGGFPVETPVDKVYIYDPAMNSLNTGHEIPENRRRGSAGTVVYNGKIYVVCGITNGHTDGHVSWFDEYDPATGNWTPLPDAPRPRDHFNAVVVEDKLYLVSGRTSSYPQTFNFTIPEVDIYNFTTGQWSTGPNNIPTQRAGAAVVAYNHEVLVIGGESMTHLEAHNETEALNTKTLEWHSMPALNTGRHGTQAVVHDNSIYIASGVGNRGGNPKLENQEIFTSVITGFIRPQNGFKIKAFPNPTYSNFSIITKQKQYSNYIVNIYNVHGKLIHTQQVVPGNPIIIPRDTPIGTYLGKVTSSKGDYIGSFSLSKL